MPAAVVRVLGLSMAYLSSLVVKRDCAHGLQKEN